jgi:hypothetical protein
VEDKKPVEVQKIKKTSIVQKKKWIYCEWWLLNEQGS